MSIRCHRFRRGGGSRVHGGLGRLERVAATLRPWRLRRCQQVRPPIGRRQHRRRHGRLRQTARVVGCKGRHAASGAVLTRAIATGSAWRRQLHRRGHTRGWTASGTTLSPLGEGHPRRGTPATRRRVCTGGAVPRRRWPGVHATARRGARGRGVRLVSLIHTTTTAPTAAAGTVAASHRRLAPLSRHGVAPIRWRASRPLHGRRHRHRRRQRKGRGQRHVQRRLAGGCRIHSAWRSGASRSRRRRHGR